jgi:hypothetical protein
VRLSLSWLCAFGSLAVLAPLAVSCFANTDGTGKGTGKETGGCYQGAFCDPGLRCVIGYCLADDEAETGGTDELGDDESGSDTSESSDDGVVEGCGDGIVEEGEACDKLDLGGQNCTTLGFDKGTLACAADCSFELSGCSNDPQPGLGQLYSHCLDDENCPGLAGCATLSEDGEPNPSDGFCTQLCDFDSDCTADVGGSAIAVCNDLDPAYCQLDCSEGRTCPGGMVCKELQSGAFVCY